MMRIEYGNEQLHDPATGVHLLDARLTVDLRAASSLKFKMTRGHPLHGKIALGSVDPEIVVWDGDVCVFRGRAYSCQDTDQFGTVEYSCEGDLSYLNDSVVRPYSTVSGEAPILAPSEPYAYANWLINKHNEQVEPRKQFKMGTNQGNLLDKNNYILRSDSTYPSTGTVVRDKLLESLGGFARSRWENGTRWFDYLADTDGVATQRIEFGLNLFDFARTMDGTSVCSCVVPLGAQDENTEDRITVKPLGDGDADSYGKYKKHGDQIDSVDLVAKFGRRVASVTFDDVTEPEHLRDLGISYLQSQSIIELIKIKAADLALIDDTVKPIIVGDYVRCTSLPHNFDRYMICSKIVYVISNPSANEYTFGLDGDNLNDIVRKHASQLTREINNVHEQSKSVEEIAKEAKERADAAKATADEAMSSSDDAKASADDAEVAANDAERAAANAQAEAKAAQAAADAVETIVTSMQTDLSNVQNAADAAQRAANEADAKANDAKTAAEEAKDTAESANTAAQEASTTASAAKLDAERAQEDINELDSQLETLSNTMTADYARKTDLTEATASLQTQITQNAGSIESTASRIVTIDETANNAAEQAASAQTAAQEAQAKADAATTGASAAQSAANEASEAAATAKSNADSATEKANAAQSAADEAAAKAQQAATDLATAKQNLADVTSRVDATEEEVAAAQTAVETAQAAADKAKADAATAQSTANTAKSNAANAQTAANNAKAAADAAQEAADEAQAAADKAQEDVNALAVRVTRAETSITQNAEAIELAATKEEVTETLGGYYTKEEADAQIKVQADRITSNVAETTALGKRMSTVEQTASGLSVRLDATDKNVAAAQSTANTAKTNAATAQTTANTAKANAATAQSTADTAKANAATAQSTANTAKTNAATAQSTADTARNEAAAAGKTATNFLEFSSAGLDVGNKTSGKWAGFRTRMAAGSFQVLNAAGTVLASYGDKLVELGKNATDAVIRMCGGKGEIKTETVDGSSTLTVSADSVATRAASGDKAAYFLARILNGVPTATACAYYDGTQSVAAVTVTPNGVSAKGDATFYGSSGQHVGSIKVVAEGTASQVGLDQLVVGNANPSGTLGNARGAAYLYGAGKGYTRLMPSNATDSHNYLNLSAIAGTGTLPAYKALYSNASGTTGTVTLSETAANFSMLEIYFKTNDGNFGCAKVWYPNGRTADLVGATYNSSASMYVKRRPVLISGTSISNNGYAGEGRVNSNNSCTTSTSAGVILICYVLGWK